MSEKKMISWNVNGLRVAAGKTFFDVFHELDADVFYIQESKLQEEQIELDLPGYYDYWNYMEEKGYSGVAMFTEERPVNMSYKLGIPRHDKRGRVVTLEFPDYYVLICHASNSQNELKRLDYRTKREDAFFACIKGLGQRKPLICCGGLDVAHEEIDLKSPLTNQRNTDFTDEEREKMTRVLTNDFVGSSRYLRPERKGACSWWSYQTKARGWNVDWHIDYSIVSERLKDRIQEASIHSEILGSDHCPMELRIGL